MKDRTVITDLAEYVERIAELRRRAGNAQRDAYTVALGQLYNLGLIEYETWREALDRTRIAK